MNVAAALVLFAVIWFMCLFLVLPFRIKSQAESGRIVRGTPASAPVNPRLLGKVKLITVLATVIWAIVCGIIVSGAISVIDLDFFGIWRDGHYG